uniref:Methyltransferase small domain-containing protein n=1 Tax=Oryza meridionalis TaxID=40149 RepID=A0A0E0DJ43_9ORYZ
MEMMEVVATEIMDAALHVAVAGRTLAVAERDGTHDPATGRALTGSWLWDSSLVLASHLASCVHHHHLRGATVLELGAGTGLPGIAAVACLGAARCVLTDVRPLLPGLRTNADANGLTAEQADVRELRGEQLEPGVQVDVVLMSDVFYDPEDMPAMAATLHGLWRDGDSNCDCDGGGGTVGWAASEVRDGVQDCVDVLREQGFEVVEVDRVTRPLLRDPEQAADFAVYRLFRRTTSPSIVSDPTPITRTGC